MSLDFHLEMEIDTGGDEPYQVNLFNANYTHNVTNMWRLAGCYHALYESDGAIASTIIDELQLGLTAMENAPFTYIALNPKNGWGDYYTAKSFLHRVLEACRAHPKATISISK